MKLKQFLKVHVSLLTFAHVIHCFSINDGDKIAVESGTQVVSDKRVYLPLGWPATIPCDSTAKLKDMNVEKSYYMEWMIRFANGSNLRLEEGGKKVFDSNSDSLNIESVTRDIDGTVIECIIVRSGNTSLISRNRVEVQDCKPQPPEDQKAYNLHNPCAFGKCQLVTNNTSVECLCFKQYSGRHCDIQKAYSWVFDVAPYLVAIVVIILHFIVTSTVSLVDEERKQVQLMGIAELSGHSDREYSNFAHLFPFTKKLRRCNFHDDGNVSRDRKKLKKKLNKMKGKAVNALPTAVQPPNEGAASTMSRLSTTVGNTGVSTRTTTTTTGTVSTGATTTTGGPSGSTMRTVSVSVSGGATVPSTRTDVTGGHQTAPTKTTNDKKQQKPQPKQQAKPQKPQKPSKKKEKTAKSSDKLLESEQEEIVLEDTVSGSFL